MVRDAARRGERVASPSSAPRRGMRRASAAAAAAAAAVLLLGAALLAPSSAAVEAAAPAESELRVPVRAEPDGTEVSLDATVVTPPGGGRHPAVVLAHGFGGSKAEVRGRARQLADEGYVAFTYTARGFGASGGRIHLMDPDVEVADARAVLDLLAQRDDVRLDAAGDPRVGIVGGSYGGALALMTAGRDRRVDAIVPSITWHDLSDALFPQSARGARGPGPLAQVWASRFFAGAMAPVVRSASDAPLTGRTSMCGRFDPRLCRLLLPAVQGGTPTDDLLAELRRRSPAATNGHVAAPTLLIQGEADSLFPLDHADATWRQLAASGVPAAMRWTDGGHDEASTTSADDEAATKAWLDRYLTDEGRAGEGLPVPAFTYAGPMSRGADTAPLATSDAYPGLDANAVAAPFETGASLRLLSPPGAAPASTIEVPGAGEALSEAGAAGFPLAALPGASASWDTAPLSAPAHVVGSPRVTLRVTSTARSATLYVSLWRVVGSGATLPARLSAPVQVATVPGRPTDVTVDLPPAVFTAEAGSTWRVLVTSTESAYATPRDARGYDVSPVGDLVLPTMPEAAAEPAGADADPETIGLLVALAVVLAAMLGYALVSRRRRESGETGASDVVLAVDHLVKTYRDGHRAVDDVSFAAHAGQVVGLLGPNGAGKTTTLRMVMGLIRPSGGGVRVLGERIEPGAPVLARVGALVEGPGFLPHASGRANLEAYWAATGRPADEAHLEEALDVAALGDAVERPVRSYSQGMRQRLGIAQAMLGLPEVLILDEPTNGLDPPQIAAMRPVLRAYAATGRTVIVSSHLLAEVEETCSHVVVMDRGRVVVTGSVADLTTSADGSHERLEDVFLQVIARSHVSRDAADEGEEMDVDAVVERLRKVRSR